ncbi:DUF4038 domain-containing protein [Chloroflexi bacterium TSY]|nr:DUF4038 domain-containing protein [Chloroflexi bacterium TSY]
MARNGANTVPRFGLFEGTHQAENLPDNPYISIEAFAIVQRGAHSWGTLPLFWDGGTTWKLRISPDCMQAETWTYTISANDRGLDGQTGSFVCIPTPNPGNRGSFVVMQSHPHHFQYQNGDRVWWFGDTNWDAFANNAFENLNRQTFEQYIDRRAAQGFNYIHTHILTPNSAGGPIGVIALPDERLNLAYFQEADVRLNYINRKGIAVGMGR